MPKVTYPNGTVVNFSKTPSDDDIRKVAEQLGITKNTINQSKKEPEKKKSGVLKNIAREIAKPFVQGAEILRQGGQTLGAVGKAGLQLVSGNKEAGKQTLLKEATRVDTARSKPLNVLGEDVGRAKTVKQAAGVALNLASNFVGAGGAAKSVATGVAKGALKSAVKTGLVTGAKAGALSGAGTALQENKNVLTGALKGSATGAVSGAVLGGALAGGSKLLKSAVDNKAFKEMVDYVAPRITNKEKPKLAASGKLTTQTLLKGEKYIAGKSEKELAKTAQLVKLTKKPNADIPKVKESITLFADKLKGYLAESQAVWNRNTIVSKLRNASKSDSMRIILKGKEDKAVYDNVVSIVDKELQKAKGGTLDKLLDIRQKVDDAANLADPNFWSKKDTPLYHAVKNVRDTLNNYINEKAGNDFVKESLKQQSNLYRILENISEKATLGKSKLLPSKVGNTIKKRAGALTSGAIGGAVATYVGTKIAGRN